MGFTPVTAISFSYCFPILTWLGGWGHRCKNPRIRAKALEVLNSKNVLDEPTLRQATTDGDSDVRRLAVHLLDGSVGPIEFKEAATLFTRPQHAFGFGLLRTMPETDRSALQEFKRRRFMQADLTKLRRFANENNADRHLAMFCLTQRDFENTKDELRSLIDDRFTSYIAEHWPEGVPKGIQNALLFGSSRPPEEEKRRELMRAALDVIEAKGDSSDLDRVRSALEDDSAGANASDIEFLTKYGSWSDAERIIRASKRLAPTGLYIGPTSNLFEPTARALLALAAEPKRILEEELPPGVLREVVVLYPIKDFSKLSHDKIVTLLTNENTLVRKSVSIKCLLSLPKRRVATLLSNYLQLERQFYNVIHWLDLGTSEKLSVVRAVAGRALGELN